MKRLAAILVIAVSLGLVLWRESRRSAWVDVAALTAQPRVVLFADLAEVDEKEGCGAIIRGVRGAARRGTATLEIDARQPSDQLARYRLLVAPTVLLFDGAGREVARFEGEAPETVRAIALRLGSP